MREELGFQNPASSQVTRKRKRDKGEKKLPLQRTTALRTCCPRRWVRPIRPERRRRRRLAQPRTRIPPKPDWPSSSPFLVKQRPPPAQATAPLPAAGTAREKPAPPSREEEHGTDTRGGGTDWPRGAKCRAYRVAL